MSFIDKFKNAVNEMAEHEDHTQAQTGGAYKPIEAGPVRLRFIEYIELGKQEKVYQGKKSFVEKVVLGFELVFGPKLTPREDGAPHIMRITLTKSLNEKSGYYKLFRIMRGDGKAAVFPQLLGEGYRAEVVHITRGEGAEAKTYAGLRTEDGGWTIRDLAYDDPHTGERVMLSCAAATAECRGFLWDYPDTEQWDSLFVDGEQERVAVEDQGREQLARQPNAGTSFRLVGPRRNGKGSAKRLGRPAGRG
jgi:hypothetical protein